MHKLEHSIEWWDGYDVDRTKGSEWRETFVLFNGESPVLAGFCFMLSWTFRRFFRRYKLIKPEGGEYYPSDKDEVERLFNIAGRLCEEEK